MQGQRRHVTKMSHAHTTHATRARAEGRNDTFNDKQSQIAERKTGDLPGPGERKYGPAFCSQTHFLQRPTEVGFCNCGHFREAISIIFGVSESDFGQIRPLK
jgi:hypothetical protein